MHGTSYALCVGAPGPKTWSRAIPVLWAKQSRDPLASVLQMSYNQSHANAPLGYAISRSSAVLSSRHILLQAMNRYDFDIYLQSPEDPALFHADEFLELVEEPLFEEFEGDVTPGMNGGVPVLYCTMVADSIESALDQVSEAVVRLGLHPVQLLMRLGNDRCVMA